MDISFELFADDLFRDLLELHRVTKYYPPKPKEFMKLESKCSDIILHAVYCRALFFRFSMILELSIDLYGFSGLDVDFYIYLQNKGINKTIFYDHLNVFDKLLMSCALVFHLMYSCWCLNIKPMNYASCWALFFESKFIDEFYAKGGWSELEVHARGYQVPLLDVLRKANPPTENDMRNAQVLFSKTFTLYTILPILSDFKERLTKSDLCCLKHKPLFFAFSKTCFPKSSLEINEFDLLEGYLQFILTTFTEEENRATAKSVLDSGQYDAIRESLEYKWKLEEMTLEESIMARLLHKEVDQTVYAEEFKIYSEDLKKAHTLNLRKKFFADVSGFDDADKRCLFCGEIVDESLKAEKSTTVNLEERIKSVICETVKNVGKVRIDSTSSYDHLDSKNLKSINTEQGLDDTLKLFLTLGLKSEILDTKPDI